MYYSVILLLHCYVYMYRRKLRIFNRQIIQFSVLQIIRSSIRRRDFVYIYIYKHLCIYIVIVRSCIRVNIDNKTIPIYEVEYSTMFIYFKILILLGGFLIIKDHATESIYPIYNYSLHALVQFWIWSIDGFGAADDNINDTEFRGTRLSYVVYISHGHNFLNRNLQLTLFSVNGEILTFVFLPLELNTN
jgi:hypothetical protein